MKYIRTKDRVFKAREEFCKGYYDKFGNPVFFEDVIKQADTIEELCDCYVIVPENQTTKPYTVNTLSLIDDIEDVLDHSDIYSSIWVNALLRPVAKMKGILPNGELDWELL